MKAFSAAVLLATFASVTSASAFTAPLKKVCYKTEYYNSYSMPVPAYAEMTVSEASIQMRFQDLDGKPLDTMIGFLSSLNIEQEPGKLTVIGIDASSQTGRSFKGYTAEITNKTVRFGPTFYMKTALTYPVIPCSKLGK